MRPEHPDVICGKLRNVATDMGGRPAVTSGTGASGIIGLLPAHIPDPNPTRPERIAASRHDRLSNGIGGRRCSLAAC
jgi:hypothetical protein